MNLAGAILSSSARRTSLHGGIAIAGNGVGIQAGRHSEKDLPAAHKDLQQVLRTAGWVHKGTKDGVTGYKHKTGASLIFHHGTDDADDSGDDSNVTAAATTDQTNQATDSDGLQDKMDEILSLLSPKKNADDPDQQSDEANNYSLSLGDQGFDHTNRHQIGNSRVVDVYEHPAGHSAVIQSKNGKVQGWGVNYGRGLGSSDGSDGNSLQQYLGKSAGFLRNESGKAAGKPGKMMK